MLWSKEMQTLLQVLVTGILLGGLYGLMSSGLSLILGITRVVNFAHGDFVTIGMYVTFFAVTSVNLHPLVSLPFVAIGMFVLGLVVYQLLILRTLNQRTDRPEDTHIAQIVITLALAILIENALLVAFSPNQRVVSGTFQGLIAVGGVFINRAQLAAFIIALICFIALYYFLTYTSFGKAMQATVDDGDMATMVGVNTRTIYAASFGIGVALAAIAGGVLVTYYPATPTAGIPFLVIIFVTVVLGGLGNIVGAFYAGMIVGIIQQATATYVAITLQNVGIFVLFIIILLLRPQGLMGRRVAA